MNSLLRSNEIKQRVNILEVIGETVTLERKGEDYWGLCPFHDERTPSFSISPEKGFFYCFGCHAGGDVYDYIMQYYRLDFKAAVNMLAARAGIKVNALTPADRRRISEARKRHEQERELANKLQLIIDAEVGRLIMLEKWTHLIIGLIRTEKVLDMPIISWAVKHKDLVSYFLDEILGTDDAAEQLAVIRSSRGVIKWPAQ